MDRHHIDELLIRGYGCIADLRLQLTSLHALIGPNDSGKSTVLRCLRMLTLLAQASSGDDLRNAEANGLFAALHACGRAGEMVLHAGVGDKAYRVERLGDGSLRETVIPSGEGGAGELAQAGLSFEQGSQLVKHHPELHQGLAGSQLLRLDPDALRQRAPLIAEGRPIRLQDARGKGLPGVYDAILNRDLPAFMAINDRVAELFPAVKALSLRNPSASEKALGVQLTDGSYVGAEHLSEGLLYFLALVALPRVQPTALVLIEEPENGLHPARIVDVMASLRELSRSTQVILATHSPLVINELQGDEVTVLTRSGPRAVTATLLQDTPNFAERSKVYALGELWVSYANGDDEAPLVSGGPRP